MEEILSRAQKIAEEVEVFQASMEQTPVVFETNRLKQLHTQQSTITTLRIVRHGKIGTATAAGPYDVQKLVERAVALSELGITSRLHFPTKQIYPAVEVYDFHVEETPVNEMIVLGQSLVDHARLHTPELICQAEVSKMVSTIHIMNSLGGEIKYHKSIFSMGLEGTLVRGEDMLFVFDSETSCHPIRDTGKVNETINRQLQWAQNNAVANTGKLPVLFMPAGISSVFARPLMVAFNGKTVLQGASPLKNKVGQQVFDKNLNISDDATVIYRPASYPADDEGVPGQITSLIEDGVVANFIYDLQTAGLAETQSTGNGDRGGGGMPVPSTSNLIIKPGQASFSDMLHDMTEGLIIEHLMGADQGNILGGDFSGNVLLGYKVEKGEVVGRVKDTMLSGNIYHILKSIAAIGNKPEWVGALQTPAILCANLSVACKE